MTPQFEGVRAHVQHASARYRCAYVGDPSAIHIMDPDQGEMAAWQDSMSDEHRAFWRKYKGTNLKDSCPEIWEKLKAESDGLADALRKCDVHVIRNEMCVYPGRSDQLQRWLARPEVHFLLRRTSLRTDVREHLRADLGSRRRAEPRVLHAAGPDEDVREQPRHADLRDAVSRAGREHARPGHAGPRRGRCPRHARKAHPLRLRRDRCEAHSRHLRTRDLQRIHVGGQSPGWPVHDEAPRAITATPTRRSSSTRPCRTTGTAS